MNLDMMYKSSMRQWDYRETLRFGQEEFAGLLRQRKAIDERL